MSTKYCIGCEQTLSWSEFGPHKRNKLQARCRNCTKKYQKEWHQRNKKRRLLQIKQYKDRKKQEMLDYVNLLKQKPCMDCGQCFPPIAMDFDHRNADEKDFCVSVLTCSYTSLDKLSKEIEKCDLVCACCHRIRTFQRKLKKIAE